MRQVLYRQNKAWEFLQPVFQHSPKTAEAGKQAIKAIFSSKIKFFRGIIQTATLDYPTKEKKRQGFRYFCRALSFLHIVHT